MIVDDTMNQSVETPKMDILYPKIDMVRNKSPVTLFPKANRPEDVFMHRDSAIKTPIMYQTMTSHMNKKGAAIQRAKRYF